MISTEKIITKKCIVKGVYGFSLDYGIAQSAAYSKLNL